ncbi:hypothetical protein BP00DRAFT_253330 [Aspergillus indologenus CBS 114.80]|uniref:Uncharacterized protein n=1 Tax=Aspergillus indologenus CBS 114.80 TaxID=1450541 RepID=A0A2V5IFA5_9EURO|nr:hypothetical protein BP00DRAFT_253330 [Aspergillus indologenus CBS 114.80]
MNADCVYRYPFSPSTPPPPPFSSQKPCQAQAQAQSQNRPRRPYKGLQQPYPMHLGANAHQRRQYRYCGHGSLREQPQHCVYHRGRATQDGTPAARWRSPPPESWARTGLPDRMRPRSRCRATKAFSGVTDLLGVVWGDIERLDGDDNACHRVDVRF